MANSNKFCLFPSNVDVTGVASIGEGIVMQYVQLRRANISFGKVSGNPFSLLQQDIDDCAAGDDLEKFSLQSERRAMH